ncbi:hypothetical protein GCM10023228_23960 [Brevibacillus fulvus]
MFFLKFIESSTVLKKSLLMSIHPLASLFRLRKKAQPPGQLTQEVFLGFIQLQQV